MVVPLASTRRAGFGAILRPKRGIKQNSCIIGGALGRHRDCSVGSPALPCSVALSGVLIVTFWLNYPAGGLFVSGNAGFCSAGTKHLNARGARKWRFMNCLPARRLCPRAEARNQAALLASRAVIGYPLLGPDRDGCEPHARFGPWRQTARKNLRSGNRASAQSTAQVWPASDRPAHRPAQRPGRPDRHRPGAWL